jgi:hypothetical protein
VAELGAEGNELCKAGVNGPLTAPEPGGSCTCKLEFLYPFTEACPVVNSPVFYQRAASLE